MLAYPSIGQVEYVTIGVIVGDSNDGHASMVAYINSSLFRYSLEILDKSKKSLIDGLYYFVKDKKVFLSWLSLSSVLCSFCRSS